MVEKMIRKAATGAYWSKNAKEHKFSPMFKYAKTRPSKDLKVEANNKIVVEKKQRKPLVTAFDVTEEK